MSISPETVARVLSSIRKERLLETAIQLIEVPSPTGRAADVADRLDEILRTDGFAVERPEAGWPDAPAVVARWRTNRPGRTLQFNGHLDTVHLPFVPPRVEAGTLYGSGASDMKGGVAAMVEALRVLRETDTLPAGGILITGHDMHEYPWGDSRQVNTWLNGTRRWLSSTSFQQAEQPCRVILQEVADQTGTAIDGDFTLVRDAFEFSPEDPLVTAFQSASDAVMGNPLPIGAKPFVDDGNAFVSRGGVPAITHGPNATGAHTVHEEVPVDELVRVAHVYALTAIGYCAE